MGSASHGSQSSGRLFNKGPRASKKKDTMQHSDFYDDELDDSGLAPPPRSISLTALNSGQVPLEPRISQLETLEAKMASIEVSLSTSPRKRKNGSHSSLSSPIIHTSNTQLPETYVKTKALDVLRNAFKDKENLNIINNNKGELNGVGGPVPPRKPGKETKNNGGGGGNPPTGAPTNTTTTTTTTTTNGVALAPTPLGAPTSGQPLSEKERRSAQEKLKNLKVEAESKRHVVKNIKLALDRLDISDNIDTRIQQAELEYQLGREELNLLTIMEESRNIQACLDEEKLSQTRADNVTIFDYVQQNKQISIHAVEINFDPKSPRFGAGSRDHFPGLYVEWATEDSDLMKGDRLLEINGKVVMGMKSKEDMNLLLAVSPKPAQIVLLRNRRLSQTSEQLMFNLREELNSFREKAGEAERTRDSFRSDNLRLTHRISYLEEQVAELLEHAIKREPPVPPSPSSTRRSSPNSPSPASYKSLPPKGEVQVFQKGPQVTTLVAGLPGLTQNSLPTIRPKNNHKSDEVLSEKSLDVKSTKSLDLGKASLESFMSKHFRRKKHHQHTNHDTFPKKSSEMKASADSLDIIQGYIQETKDNIHLHQRKKSDSILYGMNHYSLESDAGKSPLIKSKQRIYSNASLECNSSDEFSRRNSPSVPNGKKVENMSEHRNQYLRNARNTLMEYAKSETGVNLRGSRNQFFSDSRRKVNGGDCDSEPGGYASRQNIHQMLNSLKSKKTYDYGSDYGSPNLRHHYKNGNSTLERDGKLQQLQHPPSPSLSQKPIPPKKPIRLSISRAASLQSVESSPSQPRHSCDSPGSKKSLKRNHKGEAPPIPTQHHQSPGLPRSVTKTYVRINPTEKWC
ncbi:unnamed protein product [Bemisia tabaci]|uniref:PDZ domain-containing protein n=1 Tax=Bemisia tabaci TaxID=7038 RepID=A0A9P0F638_BEMTA|nr:unnamed protein product [Bemisia tabaci]